MTDARVSDGPPALRVVIVDDEPLARLRLRGLVEANLQPRAVVVGEAADTTQAQALLQTTACDAVLLDIVMPGGSGLKLADELRRQGGLPGAPMVVFVTAHAEHAVQAFDLEALDYLTKPVRLERLQAALKKAERYIQPSQALDDDLALNFILIQDRGRTERVPLADVVYLKAELKYVTVRTRNRTLIYDGSLSEFEDRQGAHWLRIHRNALVARHASVFRQTYQRLAAQRVEFTQFAKGATSGVAGNFRLLHF